MRSDAVSSSPELDELGVSIQELDRLLTELRDRYQQIQADEPLRAQLQSQISTQQQTITAQTIKAKADQKANLKAELAKLSDQLDDVEMRLESRLVSWLGLREYFWQIVRFGGFGILLGWGLTTWAMSNRSLPDEQPPLKIEQSR
jgi:uncharacterized phage infection (PIP) family protein YhgE